MLHGGDVEPVTRGSKRNAAKVQLIIHALTDRFTADPLPTQSEHYRLPGAIGSTAIPHEYSLLDEPYREIALEMPPHLTQHVLPEHGFNIMGDYV